MRHRNKINHLGRKSAHRKAMLSNMASSLILNKRINTTIAKAKALRMYVEPLVAKAQRDVLETSVAMVEAQKIASEDERKEVIRQIKTKSTHQQRVVFGHLQNKYAVSTLFGEVGTKVGERKGGYTRILKTGARLGDNAEMCVIELVDFNEFIGIVDADTQAQKTRKRRTRRSSGKKNVEEQVESNT